MTIEQAKHELETILIAADDDFFKKSEAIKMAIEALDKSKPKKPVLVEDKMYQCCSCCNNLMFKYSRYPDILMPKEAAGDYCMECGQKIDWSELEQNFIGGRYVLM